MIEPDDAIPTTEHEQYFPLLEAVADYGDLAIATKALDLLKLWDRETYINASDFLHEFGAWPYAGDPVEATKTTLMFWSYGEEYGTDGLKYCFDKEIQAASIDLIENWPNPEKALVLEACSFDDQLRPSENSDIYKEQAAVKVLARRIRDILTDADKDILTDN